MAEKKTYSFNPLMAPGKGMSLLGKGASKLNPFSGGNSIGPLISPTKIAAGVQTIPATGRVVRVGSGVAQQATSVSQGFKAGLKPSLGNVGGAALAALPALMAGDYKTAIGNAAGAYAGGAAGAAIGAKIGGTLGSFAGPVGTLIGSFIGGKVVGKLLGGGKKSPRVGAENTAKVIQQATEAGKTYSLTDADRTRLDVLTKFSGSLGAARSAITADLPNIHGGGSQSEVESHYRDLVLMNAFERKPSADAAVDPVEVAGAPGALSPQAAQQYIRTRRSAASGGRRSTILTSAAGLGGGASGARTLIGGM